MEDVGSCKIKGSSLIQRVLIGTHTSQQENEYVILGELKTPLYQPKYYAGDFENHADFSVKLRNNSIGNIPSFELKARLVHPGEVNRISHMPNNNFYFASQTNYGEVLVFDYSKHPSVPIDANVSYPQFVLQHHTKEGYGLCWNTTSGRYTESQQLPLLSSCSSDGTLCLWDISKKSHKKYTNGNERVSNSCQIIEPIAAVTSECGLNDVKFLQEYSPVVGTVTDDGRLQIYDFRNPPVKFSSIECNLFNSDKKDSCISQNNHSSFQLNCLSFNPYMNTLVITGSESGLIHLWDLRYPNGSIKEINKHREPVTQVSFSSFNAGIFGSSSHDGTISIYDLGSSNGPNKDITNTDDSCDVKELIFVHRGHQGPVNDFCWSQNPRYGHTIASVGQDNFLQCWRPLNI